MRGGATTPPGYVWPVPRSSLDPYAALVLVSFGGPEGPEEVMPFLRRVTAGRDIPDERLVEVAQHYYAFGGVSPINSQNRALVRALSAELGARDLDLPVVLGNRNSPPFLADALAPFAGRRVLAVFTSAYRSYSSCRQYREDLAAAAVQVTIDKVRPYADHPAFVGTTTRLVAQTVAAMSDTGADTRTAHVLAVAHSIPVAMNDAAGPPAAGGAAYERELVEVTAQVTDAVNARFGGHQRPDLAYCSRSGPPTQPWLEPDVNDRLEQLAAEGITAVVLAPIGFVSDHMEVLYDLDTEAAATAARLGITLRRAPTVGTDAEFVAGLVDLALDRAAEARGELATDSRCPIDCCRNLRGAKPTRCGREEPA